MNTKNKFKDSLNKQLQNHEFLCEYLNSAIEENDLEYLKIALGDVAKALGIADIAAKTDISRQSIYQMLSTEGNPSVKSLFQILKSLGLTVRIEPEHRKAS
jgi:probable addiction module antidote protein